MNAGKEYGLKINVKKTKSMVFSKNLAEVQRLSLKVDGQAIERVGKFVYLGAMIMEDGRCVNEVKRRIELARKVFTSLKWLLCNRSLCFSIRMRMEKCYVFSVLSYASETWTMNKLVVDRVKSFEMWVIRRMRRVSYRV